MYCTSCLWLQMHGDPVIWFTLYSPPCLWRERHLPAHWIPLPTAPFLQKKKLKKKENQVCKQQFVCKVRGKETEAYLKFMSAPKDVSSVSVVQGYQSNDVVPVALWSQRGQNLSIFTANHHLHPILLFFFVLSYSRKKRQHFIIPSQVAYLLKSGGLFRFLSQCFVVGLFCLG